MNNSHLGCSGVLIVTFIGVGVVIFVEKYWIFLIVLLCIGIIWFLIAHYSSDKNVDARHATSTHDAHEIYSVDDHLTQLGNEAPKETEGYEQTYPHKDHFLDNSIEYVDSLDGPGFEKFIADLIKKLDYTDVTVTQISGDQGIDVIGYKDGKKIGFQCKHYTGSVGNRAIQEAYSGKTYYNLDLAYVVTNSEFTVSADELASRLRILQWNRTDLRLKIDSAEKKSFSKEK